MRNTYKLQLIVQEKSICLLVLLLTTTLMAPFLIIWIIQQFNNTKQATTYHFSFFTVELGHTIMNSEPFTHRDTF